jgi:hypothetical protein
MATPTNFNSPAPEGVIGRADSATQSVGSGIQSLAGTIRDKGPQSGVLGNATEGLAGGLESTGRYLQQGGLSGMGRDLTDLIRRNPVPALLVGFGLGLLLSRALSSR